MSLLNLSPLQLTLTLSKYTGKFILPLVQIWQRGRKFVPPIEDELLLMSVLELAESIREQKITSVAVVSVYIDRILTVNTILNAVMDERFADALKEAKKADHLCNEMDKDELLKNFPLLGVPFTVKEMIGVKGLYIFSWTGQFLLMIRQIFILSACLRVRPKFWLI